MRLRCSIRHHPQSLRFPDTFPCDPRRRIVRHTPFIQRPVNLTPSYFDIPWRSSRRKYGIRHIVCRRVSILWTVIYKRGRIYSKVPGGFVVVLVVPALCRCVVSGMLRRSVGGLRRLCRRVSAGDFKGIEESAFVDRYGVVLACLCSDFSRQRVGYGCCTAVDWQFVQACRRVWV